MLDKTLVPAYNVLVLGETQSGKSTLIQSIRKYADTSIDIDTTALGTGFLSHTQKVNITSISTDLPECSVVDKSGTNIIYSKFIKMPDGNDFEDALNMRHGLETTKGRPRLSMSTKFNIIDTPGLNSTGRDDEQNVQSIFNALNTISTIHLILITFSLGPFTRGLNDAIKTYVDLISGFPGTIAFVNTHFDYKYFHPTRAQISHAIDHRTERLRRIIGETMIHSFKIDCNISSRRPIRNCITQNTILEILELATLSQPVHLPRSFLAKTRKMRDIDNILRPQFESALADFERTTVLQGPNEKELLADVLLCNTRIHKLKIKIKALDEFFVRQEVPLLEIQYNERVDMQHMVIDQKRTVEICHQETRVQHVPIQRDQLHHQVKIHTTMLNKCRADIEENRKQHWVLQRKMERAIRRRDKNAHHREKWSQEVMDAIDDHAEKLQVLEFLASEFLMPEVFKALINAEAYIGDTAQCIKKVQKVYAGLARKHLSTSTITTEV
ncbi:hypothetical protein BGZ59_000829 [Podila verticillata]|uniref:Uncharacterized protein n=1 Tax=Podila verticillata NRRL 6337 TaxID=1069443 RepID=A0A086TJC4_9FUNG|nr:hypothetical protein BGZ59_000829 [Podila verticillata]KFH62051.1 hypothetical protein MVEG_12205 [Podila verticillata NRRL 6337]